MLDHAPLLVTLGFDPDTFTRLDALRTEYFPPERNFVPAHLSLFHHLPASEVETVQTTLIHATRDRPPIALVLPGLKRLGRGMAATVSAPGLSAFHAHLARSFSPWLTPQDRQPFRPHVTLMNKAEPKEAELAFLRLSAAWEPIEGTGDAVLLWKYLGGPWELVRRYPFEARSGTTES